jgi:hypothetical protein
MTASAAHDGGNQGQGDGQPVGHKGQFTKLAAEGEIDQNGRSCLGQQSNGRCHRNQRKEYGRSRHNSSGKRP